MTRGKERKSFERPVVDEDYLMQIMSGDEPAPDKIIVKQDEQKESKPRERAKSSLAKKVDYEETFLVNRFPSGRSGKVVYIRSEFHERLLRIVQLTREDKVTLYSYIDNILEYHFREFGGDITDYFNDRFKPII
ncbi:DUF3408 domain-containing protein [Chryseobacterium bernardetii]|uniref:DUF3408 domain-containing protein n=1 Tax=Chryseobacterium bernardetii TaxID=1241978 RepID=A0A3G6TGA3_9FLAO|nr:DUF3408 domain-containing protein [Chryseobacterium bernardetii]AZB26923.1 DUF3408 domain-containing protein [Chryseobacterium bernardetii]